MAGDGRAQTGSTGTQGVRTGWGGGGRTPGNGGPERPGCVESPRTREPLGDSRTEKTPGTPPTPVTPPPSTTLSVGGPRVVDRTGALSSLVLDSTTTGTLTTVDEGGDGEIRGLRDLNPTPTPVSPAQVQESRVSEEKGLFLPAHVDPTGDPGPTPPPPSPPSSSHHPKGPHPESGSGWAAPQRPRPSTHRPRFRGDTGTVGTSSATTWTCRSTESTPGTGCNGTRSCSTALRRSYCCSPGYSFSVSTPRLCASVSSNHSRPGRGPPRTSVPVVGRWGARSDGRLVSDPCTPSWGRYGTIWFRVSPTR